MAAVFIQWAIWNNKLLKGTHEIPKNINIWFSEVSHRKGFVMTFNRKQTFVINQFVSIIRKKMAMLACCLLLPIIVIIIVIIASSSGKKSGAAQPVLAPDAYCHLTTITSSGNPRLLGVINFYKNNDGTLIKGAIKGLDVGEHGFHIHANPI